MAFRLDRRLSLASTLSLRASHELLRSQGERAVIEFHDGEVLLARVLKADVQEHEALLSTSSGCWYLAGTVATSAATSTLLLFGM